MESEGFVKAWGPAGLTKTSGPKLGVLLFMLKTDNTTKKSHGFLLNQI